MAATAEVRKRQLVVRELPPLKGGPVRELSTKVLREMGIVSPEFIPTTPRTKEIPRELHGRKGLRGRKERQLVTQAMLDLAMGSDQGTRVSPRRFTVSDQFTSGGVPGRENKIARLRWQRLSLTGPSVGARLKDDVVRAKREVPREAKMAPLSKDDSVYALNRLWARISGDPASLALRQESRDHKALKRADEDEVIHGWFGWRARGRALLYEARPITAKEIWKPGQSRARVFQHWDRLMDRITDVQLDPEKKIGGPFEPLLEVIQQAGQGFSGIILTKARERLNIDADLYNDITGKITLGSKLFSPDMRRSLLSAARSYLGLLWYTRQYYKWYQSAQKPVEAAVSGQGASKKKKEKIPVRRLLFGKAPPPLVEKAMDRRANRYALLGFDAGKAILDVRDYNGPASKAWQLLVAQEYIRAYEAPPGYEGGIHKISTLVGDVMDRVDKAKDTALGLPGQMKDAISGAIAAATAEGLGWNREGRRRRLLAAKGVVTDKAAELRQTATELRARRAADTNYAAEPLSHKEHVERILAHVESSDDPVQIVKWAIAKREAAKWAATYARAQELVAA